MTRWLIGWMVAMPAMASPPPMSHSGILRDASGALIEGEHRVDVTLFNDQDEQVWADTFHEVPFDRGVFTVLIGEEPPLTAEMLSEPLFLQLAVDEVPFPDLHALTAVPYAGWAYGVQLANLPTCTADLSGALRWTGERVEVCDGTAFQPLTASP